MNDYAPRQNWRQPDADVERENGFAAICTTAFVCFVAGVAFAGWWFA